MLKDGFLRFCDDPEIACCRGEAELGSYDEVKGITNFKTWIEHAEIRHDCGDKPTFEEFKPICLKMFSVKKLYREA